MLSNSETIIYLKRTELEIVKVATGLVKKIVMRATVPWNEENINAIVKAIPDTFKTKSIRILIDIDICYSLVIPWEKTINPTRKEIQNLAEQKIPEHLDNEWWDYKLLLTNNGKKILLFAPVQDIYKKFIQAVEMAELNNHGSYPLELLPKTENDFITFAQINLNGRDEETLTLKPENETPAVTTVATEAKPVEKILTQPQPKKSSLASLLLILVGLVVVLAVVLLTKKSATTTQLESNIDQNVVTPIPTEITVNLADYSILIQTDRQNQKLAKAAEETLKAEGFSLIETSVATQTATISQIALRKDVPIKVYDEIIRTLNSDFDFSNQAIELEENNQYHIVVTLGEGKETAQ